MSVAVDGMVAAAAKFPHQEAKFRASRAVRCSHRFDEILPMGRDPRNGILRVFGEKS